MTLTQITAAMQTYSAQRNQNGKQIMKGWFAQGNMYTYTPDNSSSSNLYVHIYPAVNPANQLVMLVINAEKDVQSNTNIANDVQVCSVSMVDPSQSGNGGGLPSQEALGRINAWYAIYVDWIKTNIGAPDSIFQALRLPKADANFGNQHNAFLALKPYTVAPITNANSDIVIQDVATGVFQYFDTGLPQPPYSGTGEYYLLSLI